MKRKLLCSCLFCATALAVSPAADPGGIIFIGDSITQGGYFNGQLSSSYRYSLFKNFVDNGLTYNPMGTTNGASGGRDVSSITPDYQGVSFDNTSESAASARSYQYAGHGAGSLYRGDPGTVLPTPNRGPLSVKFGLSNPDTGTTDTFYNGSTLTTYTGDTYASLYGDQKAETACIMIGINDLFDMSQNGRQQTHEQIIANVNRIVSTLQEYNPDINVMIMGCLPVGRTNGALSVGQNNVVDYNALLQQAVNGWSTSSSQVSYADVSEGFYASNGAMIDGTGGAHPNAQGELIIAGNIARALGVGQRTMGLERRAATGLNTHAALSSVSPVVTTTAPGGQTSVLGTFTHSNAAGGAAMWTVRNTGGAPCLSFASAVNSIDDIRLNLTPSTDSTVRTGTFSFTLNMVHDEVAPGSNFLSIFIGDGKYGAGILAIGEDGIYWGNGASGTLLYGSVYDEANSHFMTTGIHEFRIVISGTTADGTKGLFQIWLNGQLIGENKTATLANSYKDTLLIGKRTGSESTYADLHDISLELDAAYAPVPEPGSAALDIAGLTVLLWRRRKEARC